MPAPNRSKDGRGSGQSSPAKLDSRKMQPWQIRGRINPRCDASWLMSRRVPDAIPPRKAPREEARARFNWLS
jgi:hypothetical protein